MIALDARRLAGVSALYHETIHSPPRKVHRQAQPDRAATDNQHFGLVGFAHERRILSRTMFAKTNPRSFTEIPLFCMLPVQKRRNYARLKTMLEDGIL